MVLAKQLECVAVSQCHSDYIAGHVHVSLNLAWYIPSSTFGCLKETLTMDKKVKSIFRKAWWVIPLCLGLVVIVFLWRRLSSDDKYTSVEPGDVVEGIVVINGTAAIGTTDDDFICATLDWWPPEKCDYGTCSWGNASLFSLDLKNPRLINAIKAFSPLKIRLGGTLQDKIIYEIPGYPCTELTRNTSEMFGFTEGCLPLSRWDELNYFFNQTGAVVIFGLNALKGKSIRPDGSAVGRWDSTNAESLIRYSVDKGYTIHGWELGNEVGGNAIGASISVDQYAQDTKKLHSLIHKIYADVADKPIVLGPGGFFEKKWFERFIEKTEGSLEVVSHHIYNLGPGNDPDLMKKILDPNFLSRGSELFSDLQGILQSTGTSAVAWVGEAGGAYNSGHHKVTDTFAFSFWYLDQLGMASTYDTKTYCRQSLIGGNYGLLETNTMEPNPDYYSALLWHRLMGRNVLFTSFLGFNKLRAYAHCSKAAKGITVLLINLSQDTTVHVYTPENSGRDVAKTNQHDQTRRLKKSTDDANTREEYHLTAKDGDLQSSRILLNGKQLTIGPTGRIPLLEPVKVNVFDPIVVAPFSIVFAQIASLSVPACSLS